MTSRFQLPAIVCVNADTVQGAYEKFMSRANGFLGFEIDWHDQMIVYIDAKTEDAITRGEANNADYITG